MIGRYSGKEGDCFYFITVKWGMKQKKKNNYTLNSCTPFGLVFDAILLVLQNSETLMQQLQD